uniref:Membrane protein insertion efficiency factor n=1 Tax=Leersia perrieri TaxID=77586 RepID=A0A0D9XVR5_9ORYZ
MAAAAALLSPAPAVRPLSGTTLSFGVPYKNKTRIRTMRVCCTADEEGYSNEEEANDLGVNAALSMLKFYKREISPLLPSSCRYVPTCSEYSMQAYKRYGVAKGTILTAWRLCRCNPLGGHGYDPPSCHKRGCLGVVLHVTISRKTSLLTIVLTRAMPRSGSDVKEDGKDGGIDFFEPPDPRILLVIDIMMKRRK